MAWRGMEKSLDSEMVATAYTTSMNTNVLQHAAMCTTELTPEATRTCFQGIMSANIAHWGTDGHVYPMRSVHPCMWSGALIALMDVSSNDAAWSPLTLVAALKTAYSYIKPWNRQLHSDIPGARLLCVDFARIIRHYGHSALPLDSLNIAERIYQLDLRDVMEENPDLNLGNDVRQHGNFPYTSRFVDRLRANACIPVVESVYIGDVLKGLEGAIIEDKIERALFSLRCIIYCVPSRTGSDYKPDDPEYKAMQSHAACALEALFNLLSTSPSSARRCAFEIHNVLVALRMHGERAGLMSVELRQAIVRYWDSADEEIRWYLCDHEEWIQTLRREMDDSGQKLPAGVATTSGRASGPLIVAAQAAVCNDSLSVAAASTQIFRAQDAHVQTEIGPENGSSTPSASQQTTYIVTAVNPNDSVAITRGAADAHPPTELDANGRSDSAPPPPSIFTVAVDESADSHPGAVEDERGAQLAATEFSITAAPPFSDHTATMKEPAVSVPGTAEGDRGAQSQEKLATNGSSSAPSTPPPSPGGSGLP
ncbi:hypothetical protein K466DRAFT_657176 [Polyporus arcularius HHB13444]|uniref:Uncharacterized protein n=1 Tax=Polyporus arcularius HHB13444 TaxID=1314778 RepID=A0A5C3NPH1_9APHY|nr:hypothetical protein K466DRAFT_657176 [Polyporus arcularius HHB13444]